MRRHAVIASIAVLLLSAFPEAGSAMPADTVQPKIVGGDPAAITDVPWQVALLDPARSHRQFCGGSILDASHVVTAAHCVTDGIGTPYPPAEIEVLAGTADVQDRAAPAQLVQLSDVDVHPEYSLSRRTDDVALLTLQTPLALGPAKAKLPPAAATPPPGTTATVSGWGSTAPDGGGQRYLRSAQVNVLADGDPTCAPAAPYEFDSFQRSVLLCAAASGRDSCQGDSGGPLAAGGALIGVVAFGEGCADPAYAGVYTEVSSSSVHDFITGKLPMPAPGALPSLTGTPLVGETLTCNPGSWSFDPTFRYAFIAWTDVENTVQPFSATRTYALTEADANRTIGCLVEARSASGAVRTEATNTVGPVQRRVVTTTVTVTTPPPPLDTTTPRSTVVARRCTRTSCRVDVLVEDPGYSTGVKGIELRYVSRWRVRCRKSGRRTTCVRSRRGTVTAVGLGNNVFAARLRNLRAGSSTVATITAIDKAGNRERTATTTVLRTTKPKRTAKRS